MKFYVISKKVIGIVLAILLFITIFLVCSVGKTVYTFYENQLQEPIRSADEEINKMAFTCNVDWGNEELIQMLDIFEKKNIHITFFITGRWAKNNEELVKLIASKGHEIGNHAYSHKMHSKISEDENYEEIKKTNDVLKGILKRKAKYFAPPSGDYGENTLKAAQKLGYTTILWSIDTIDWREDSTKDVIVSRVMKKPHQGAILLMHPKKETVKALPYLIDSIQKEGIEIGTVSDLLKK